MELNRIYNMDCLEGMKRIPDKSVDMILCDLPYGTTACSWDEIIPFSEMWSQYNRVIKNNGLIVLTGDEPFTSKLINSNILNFKYRITWNKMQGGGFLNAKKMVLKQTEDICVFSNVKLGHSTYNPQMRKKETHKIRKIGKRNPVGETTYGKHNGQVSKGYDNTVSYPTNLISISSKSGECNSQTRFHPTQKPVALFEYLIKTYTNEDETVLDNCMGSGTTAIACMNTKRNFIGFELDETYYNKSLERIKEHTTQTELFDYL